MSLLILMKMRRVFLGLGKRGNQHGSIKLLHKTSAKEFGSVLREMQNEFEDEDFALYFGEVMPKIQERDATFKRNVHSANYAGL